MPDDKKQIITKTVALTPIAMNIPEDLRVMARPEDIVEWDKHIEHCGVLQGVNDYEKERARRAIRFLREELGEGFLKKAFSTRHPIFEYFANLAPWTREWVVWFADSLKAVRKAENYDQLRERLLDKDRFPEALTVLDVSQRFSQVGFSVGFDPKVTVGDRQKVPDIRVTDTGAGETFYVEVSAVTPSVSETRALETMHRVTEPVLRSIPFINYCGRIQKSLAEPHLVEIVEKIKKIVSEVKVDGAFRELVVEKTLELGMAGEADKDLLQKWASQRGLEVGTFRGPSYDPNEVGRTKRKIGDEQRQLPDAVPNLVVIQNERLFTHKQDMRAVIGELEEEVYAHPNLLGAVVFGRHLGLGDTETVMEGQHVYTKKGKSASLQEENIVLFNRFCGTKVSPGLITKMYEAFRTY
jgi:hypothetical protein